VNAVKRDAGVSAPAESAQTPTPTAQGVRFRLRAGPATTVVVIGSWNDWDTDVPAQRLRRTRESGLWEAWVPVPPGDHRYHFLVDGRAVRPADAIRYRPDGFGGEDGVLEIMP
jgi:1,4-alpha-glucan branching enzyme